MSLAESPRFKTTGTRDDALPPDMEDVAQSPGLTAILTSQYQVDRPRKMLFGNEDEDENVSKVYDETFTLPSRAPTYPWNKSIDPTSGSFNQERSDITASAAMSLLGTDQGSAIIADKLARVTKLFLCFKNDSARKDADLGDDGVVLLTA